MSRHESKGPMPPVERKELLLSVLQTCGYGRVLVIGLTSPEFLEDLLAEGVDAWGVSRDARSTVSGRFTSRIEACGQGREFETVIALVGRDAGTGAGDLDARELADAMLGQVGRQFFIVLNDGLGDDGGVGSWRAAASDAGLVPHLQRHRVEVDDNEAAGRHRVFLLFERPRDSGEGSDASPPFYLGAVRYVRPDDTILDLAQVRGGADLLARLSPARRVTQALDEPADLVIAAVSDADLPAELSSLRIRVSAGGRCIVQVNDPVDVSATFVEGDRLPGYYVEAVHLPGGGFGDSTVLVLLADLEGPTRRDESVTSPAPNILAFGRDYHRPGIVRALVSIGLRTESRLVRERFARELMALTPRGSADYGAALCVLCYALLERRAPDEALAEACSSAMAYVSGGYEAHNPTVHRWRISLSYVAGLIALHRGERDVARRALGDAVELDPLAFSPLVATKTVAAWRLLGTMSLADGDAVAAGTAWSRGIDAAKRVITQGDWVEIVGTDASPATFGLPEAATVLLEAARCHSARAGLTGRNANDAGRAWASLHGTVLDEVALQRLAAAANRAEIDRLMAAVAWAEDHRLATDAWVAALTESKDWLDDQRARWEDEAQKRGTRIHSLEHALDGAQGEVGRLKELVEARNAELERIRDGYAESARLSHLVHGEIGGLAAKLAGPEQLGRSVTDLLAYIVELQEAKEWLVGQLASHQREMMDRGEQLSESRVYVRQLLEGKAWLEGHVDDLHGHVRSEAREMGRLQAAVDHLDSERALLAARLDDLREGRDRDKAAMDGLAQRLNAASEWAAQLEDQRRVVAQQRDELAELNKAIAGYVYNSEASERDATALKGKLALAQADGRLLIAAGQRESRRIAQLNASRWVRLGRWLGLLRWPI